MSTTATAASSLAAATTPELDRHQWQNLSGLIASIRPDWPIDQIAYTLDRCRNLQTFSNLVTIAMRVAGSPRFSAPSSIGMVAAGLIDL